MTRQQRSEATREALLESGGRVFASTPYDKARIADVHEPLGLTQGAFYFHFANKHELALEIIRREHELMVNLSERVLLATDNGLQGLRETSVQLAKLIREDLTVQAGLRLTSHNPEEFPEFLGSSFEIWDTTINQFLKKAQDQEQLREQVDLDTASRFVVATFMGVQEISGITTRWADIEEQIQRVSLLAIRSLATDECYSAIVSSELASVTSP